MSTENPKIEYVRFRFPNLDLWLTHYQFHEGNALSIATTVKKDHAKIYVSPDLAEIAEIGRRLSRISPITVDQSTFDEWINTEAGVEAKT